MSNKSLFEGIPAALAALPRWVRWEYHSVNGKKTKVPITMAGALASTTDPTTWTSLQSVNEFDKIGFVFVKEDGIVGIDLDHVLVEGEPVAWARAVVADASSYTEGSPSGSGLHIIGTGAKPAWLPNRIDMPGEAGIEIYDHGRYFTMTGRVFEGHCELAAIDVESLLWWVKDLLPREQSSVPTTTKRKLSATSTSRSPPSSTSDRESACLTHSTSPPLVAIS